MSISLIFKIAAVGILVTVLSQVLKHSGREEHAFLTSLAGLLIVLFWIVPYIYELFETMQSSVTRSKTSITKSLPASFKPSIFTLFSESYNKIHCFKA